MRVLMLSPEPPPLGVLHALARRGIEPVVAVSGGASGADGAVQFLRIPARLTAHHPERTRWSRRALRAAVRDISPALIHLVGDPWTPTAEAGAAAARKANLPYVLVATSSRGGAKGVVARWQADRVRDGAAGLGGAVRPALDLLTGGSTEKPTAIIPQGTFQIPSELPFREDPPPVRFAVVGRVAAERGLDLLLDALGQTYGDWRLVIIGTGPLQEALEQQAQRLGLSSRIEWRGVRPRAEIAGLWAEVDAVVAPSRSTPAWIEPSGNLVLEAMAHAVVPIVSRCGALPEVVADAGMIIDEEDTDALARALQALVQNPARCIGMGLAARQRVLQAYSDDALADRLIGWWRRVVIPAA